MRARRRAAATISIPISSAPGSSRWRTRRRPGVALGAAAPAAAVGPAGPVGPVGRDEARRDLGGRAVAALGLRAERPAAGAGAVEQWLQRRRVLAQSDRGPVL